MKPMLAATIDSLADVRYPVLASTKLDGIRGLIINGQLRSRSLKLIPNPYVQALFGRPEFNMLDGELILGDPTAKDVYRVTNGACSRHTGTPNVQFHVFDLIDGEEAYELRLQAVKLHANELGIVIVKQVLIENERELLKYEEFKLDEGYEGLILRDPKGLYKSGRSTIKEGGMLKLKRFADGEARILAIEEEMENTNEAKTNELGRTERSTNQAGMVGKHRAGTLLVEDVNSGVEFRVGTGLDDEDKAWFWKNRKKVVGQMIKYKHFPVGAKDKPRHPVYLGGREEWDL